MRTLVLFLVLFLAVSLLLTGSLLAAGPDPSPRLRFSKAFPGSFPAWEEIVVDKNGVGHYKDDPKDEDPLKFQLTPDEAGQMFSLADKMDHFAHPLESHVKVANMGMKTLGYEADGVTAGDVKSSEVKFNYTEDLDGRALADWFERIADTERGLIQLQTAVRFDKLGAQAAILKVEIIWNQKRLVGAEQFLPMLDRVAKNESFLHISRERAAALADSIRGLPK